MKNFTLLSLIITIGFCTTGFSQCNDGTITGYFTLILGQTTSFTATPNAQCDNCYDWDINNHCSSSDNQTIGTLKIVGNDMEKTLLIEPTAVGTFSIHLSYIDEKGYHTASFMGNVVNNPNEITLKENTVTYVRDKKK
ncbi:hypothetical protein FIA58_000025 [Flavobacterium jejuense]|uniref:Uncharacterized protein n=1 Tax=Flavobacterium jejuense TaxID=1544455 RepID=A0ABX0IKD6_9FLAO|nr:hypothetical protein [Flavobacterium jejuense]NHN24048.1 hypothetical protein [Flavobacterium jejuense]